MKRISPLALACAVVLLVGCANNNGNKSKTSMNKQRSQQSSPSDATWARGDSSFRSGAAPTDRPSVQHPLAGAWELAVPRRRMSDASITASDDAHVTISAGNNWLSGDYVQQGSFLLMLSNDERQRPIAWKINSNDSLTLVRAVDSTGAPSRFIGTTLLRAPGSDNSMAETDMGDIFGQ